MKQYGFCEKKNTLGAASCVVNDIVNSLERKKQTSCLFIDIKKAFDCLNFHKLLKKLHFFGFREKALNLLKSYLTNRKQFVSLDNVDSQLLDITSGAAQGSVLGPILFLIYINDMLNLNLHGELRLFADDAAIVYSASNSESLEKQMKSDLENLFSFLNSLDLSMSTEKTKFIIFNKHHKSFDHIILKGEKVERVSEFKYLGIWIDQKLSWNKHVNEICSKISPFIGLISRIRYFTSKKNLMDIYYSFIHSRLTYCLPVWCSTNKNNLQKLQVKQNKVLKFINFKKKRTSSHLLYGEKILPFIKHCEFETTLFMYKIKHNLTHIDFNLKTYDDNDRSRRNLGKFKRPDYRSNIAQKSIFYRGVIEFNEMFEECNLIPDRISLIKTKIKKNLSSSHS
jgi:ribonucleases P/MRP protein subunit RPP40